MKTNIILNIGLETINETPIELHHAIHEIERAGITMLSSGIVTGQWEGKTEQTLVLQGLAFPGDELDRRIYSASRALSQHCIAIWQDGKGRLIGNNSGGFTFDPDLFHFHAREVAPELSPCEAIQAKHKAEAERLNQDAVESAKLAFDGALTGGRSFLRSFEDACHAVRQFELNSGIKLTYEREIKTVLAGCVQGANLI